MQPLDRNRERRQLSLCALVSSDNDHAHIFPPPDSKCRVSEPLAHSSAPCPRAFSARARQSSSDLLPLSFTPFDEPMPSEFSLGLPGHQMPRERTPSDAVRNPHSSGSKPSHSTKRLRLLFRGTARQFSHSDTVHRFLPMTFENSRSVILSPILRARTASMSVFGVLFAWNAAMW